MYIVNPPLTMVSTSDESYENLVKSHAERFNDKEFRMGHYIFFTKGQQGRYFPNALPLFFKFMNDIEAISPNVKDKLRITVADTDAPGFTFFCGTKHVEKETGMSPVSYAITYINEEPLMYQNGFSNWAFISLNDSFNSTLEDYALNIINKSETLSWEQFKTENNN